MRVIILAAAATGLGTAGYMGGSFESGEYYEMAPAEVSENLARMSFPAELEDSAGHLSLRKVLADSGEVRWDIVRGSYSVAEIRAELSPSGEGTRVNVEFTMLEGPEKEMLGSVVPADNEFLGDVIELAMTEQIDATLEKRPFDQQKLGMMMANYMAANPGKVAAFHKGVQENMDASLQEADSGLPAETFHDYTAFEEESFDEPDQGDWGE